LLLGRLGLRAGEVRQLQKADIDWSTGRVRIVGKLRRPVWLPLPQEVGDAILNYLSKGRCVSTSLRQVAREITDSPPRSVAAG
jgi:integrase